MKKHAHCQKCCDPSRKDDKDAVFDAAMNDDDKPVWKCRNCGTEYVRRLHIRAPHWTASELARLESYGTTGTQK